MKKSISNPYTGKPVCAVHFQRQIEERWKLLLVQWTREKIKGAA